MNESVQTFLPQSVENMRKADSRSRYSDQILTESKKYLEDSFSNLPIETKEKLKENHTVILLEGSVLRGTVTERTHDIDVFIVTDSESDFTFDDLSKSHPDELSLNESVIQNIDSTIEDGGFSQARRVDLQRRQDYVDKKFDRTSREANMSSNEMLFIDALPVNIDTVTNAIQEADATILADLDIPDRVIASILTATPELVYESSDGALLHHQKRIVDALIDLKKKSPQKFENFYSGLERSFVNLHRSQEFRYPERDFRLLGEYYLNSGRYQPRHIEKSQLLNISTKVLLIEEVKRQYDTLLSSHPDYNNDPDLLKKHLLIRFGLESGVTVDDLNNMLTSGKEYLTDNLSDDAKKEVADFEKRIKLLKAIRAKTTFPTIEEFQKAYA